MLPQQDIFRLDVAVDHVVGMRVGQCGEDLAHYLGGLELGCEVLRVVVAHDLLEELPASEKFSDDVDELLVLVVFEHPQDIRMVHFLESVDFPHSQAAPLFDPLQGPVYPQFLMLDPKHLPIAAVPQFVLQHVVFVKRVVFFADEGFKTEDQLLSHYFIYEGESGPFAYTPQGTVCRSY
jgi:hypothetical protein